MDDMLAKVAQVPRAPLHINEFIVGTVCGGSDATSGITANPGIGRAFDRLVEQKAGCIFEETGELIGCEDIMTARAATPALAGILRDSVTKAAQLLHRARPRQFRARQRRRRTHDDGGKMHGRLRQERRVARFPACSSPATFRRAAVCICSMSCPTAKCASVFRTSTTTPRSPNSSPAART